jgi:RNA polymerase sigma-70 factor, ECF subfamily
MGRQRLRPSMPPVRELPAPDDPTLLAAVRAGSAEALGLLYSRHADMVFGAAFRMLGSRADAEDVLQDIFVGLPEALQGYEDHGRFAHWLKRVAVRAALMRLRARERRREEPIELMPELPSAGGETSEIVERIAAQRAIATLPDALRTVFLLKEVEGYSHREIAALLGISSSASAVRLFRAWRAIHARLAREA